MREWFVNSVVHRQSKMNVYGETKIRMTYLLVIHTSLAGCSPFTGVRPVIQLSDYSVKLPATGYRNNSNGALNNTGSNGYYWSASPNSSTSNNASILNFNSSNVNVNNSNNRANGNTVRCVEH